MDTIQDEVAPQVDGDKVENVSSDANEISVVEEKATEEKADDAREVGFKKIFRFVGFKFTLKKDKGEEKDDVKLLTVKEKEEEESKAEELPKETEAADVEEKTAEEKVTDTEASTVEVIEDGDEAETTEAVDEPVKEEESEKEVDTTLPSPETTVSSFRRFFNTSLFSNLRKKASMKKTKEEEDKEVPTEEETVKTEDAATAVKEEVKGEVEQETKEPAPETPVEEQTEHKEEVSASPEEAKSDTTEDPEATSESPVPTASATDDTKQKDEKIEPSAEQEGGTAEVTSEAELLSSQEKAKPQGSPLKKLFTGAGLKKLSTKKQKTKKDTENKLTESGGLAAEQLQSSTDSAEAPKTDSGPSSPEDSGEHALAAEMAQIESSQESHGEVVSDGEKKKEGIIAWSSFKKLVTPKRRVKRSSESDEEATDDKPAKSATLSSSESATLADKSAEEETKEDKPSEEEQKTENTEKLVNSTEEPKKKMDTSVSWEALMCMGGPKKRTRKTSDSDDEETKIEEESRPAAGGEQEGKTKAANVTSQNTESEGKLHSAEHPDRETAWDTLKRVVMPKTKAKVEEKTGESPEQVQSDSEAPKDESSFSFKKFLPGRRKKKADRQASSDQGSSEDDSDTPAVVPLSEYNEQGDVKEEAAAEPATEPAVAQTNASVDNRSPSWIPAIVEDADKRDELSDIPEDVETAATSKSVDTDTAEDEIEDEAIEPPKDLEETGRRLSIAEVKPVALAPAGETTPVPQRPKPENAVEIIEGIEVKVSEIPRQTSVTVTNVPIEVASEKTEYEPSTDIAESKTNAILEPHSPEEAMAICTGLGTKEIAKIALEKPAMTIIENVAVIGHVLSTEVVAEEKPHNTVEADVTEDTLLKAQVHKVETTNLELPLENSQSDIQVASERQEPEVENIAIVSTVVEQSEVLQPSTTIENSPKANFIRPSRETTVCTTNTEVTESTVQVKEKAIDVEQLKATEEYTPVKATVEATCETTSVSVAKETDAAIPVNVPCEEIAVITETMVHVCPSIGSDQMETSGGVTMSESVNTEVIQVQETSAHSSVVEAVESSALLDDASEKMEELQQTGDLEAKSIVIAQAVIQDAMDKVSEEPKKPTTPTATIPTPVQAVASTEEEIISDTPVISEPPNVVTCEKLPQPLSVAMEFSDNILVEVVEINSTATLVENEKPETIVKKAVEEQVSENTVIVEEVVEIKAESKSGEDLEQIQNESKENTEVQEPDTKEEDVEVKPDSEESQTVALSEEEKPKVLEIHMPVQVVLHTAQVMEDESVEEEAAEEFDSHGTVDKDASLNAGSTGSQSKLPVLPEDPQVTAPMEDSAPSQVPEAAASRPEAEKSSSLKYAEVMAQVIDVIEEAVKEIEPVLSDNTAAS